jgi:hypothetical protein
LTNLLFEFSKRVSDCKGDAIKIHVLCSENAESFAKLINAHTTAALVSFHVMFKKEMLRVMDEMITNSGMEVIESFKNSEMKKGA